MWKCAFPFFAALLTVGSAQVPGGPTDINANDPEVQAALKFAMKEYNKGSSDQYLYVVVDVISVQGQVVAGYNYFLTVKIAKTLCRKNSNVSGCSAITNSPMAKTYECTFKVFEPLFGNDMQLTEQQCHQLHSQPRRRS
ncbi:cystatin-like [Oryzias latipes]|uniref:cystatin-like n=1 Tax=Oryzias latipes TaxID=8090 RepID=UPI0002A4CE58|nr:cystatin-like [Oryzias latipes]